MTNYPFSSPIQPQLEHLATNLELLRQFAARYPDAEPASCSNLIPFIQFPASAAGWCRDNLGSEGWTISGHTASKDVMGVCVQLTIEAKTPQPFVL